MTLYILHIDRIIYYHLSRRRARILYGRKSSLLFPMAAGSGRPSGEFCGSLQLMCTRFEPSIATLAHKIFRLQGIPLPAAYRISELFLLVAVGGREYIRP